MLTSIVAGLLYYTYCYPPMYNMIVTALFGSHMVVPMLEFNWFTVLMWGILSLPLLLIIGAIIAAYNEIAYKTGWGL